MSVDQNRKLKLRKEFLEEKGDETSNAILDERFPDI